MENISKSACGPNLTSRNVFYDYIKIIKCIKSLRVNKDLYQFFAILIFLTRQDLF